MSKACIDDRSDSLIFQHKRRPRVIGFTYASSEAHFRSTESQTFYRPIMTANDSIKCRCANSGMTGQVGGFQNPGVCLQAFPSFLSHPLSALLLAPFFARSLTLIPRSLLLNRTETLATQAIFGREAADRERSRERSTCLAYRVFICISFRPAPYEIRRRTFLKVQVVSMRSNLPQKSSTLLSEPKFRLPQSTTHSM